MYTLQRNGKEKEITQSYLNVKMIHNSCSNIFQPHFTRHIIPQLMQTALENVSYSYELIKSIKSFLNRFKLITANFRKMC